jgi:hypothetical protein
MSKDDEGCRLSAQLAATDLVVFRHSQVGHDASLRQASVMFPLETRLEIEFYLLSHLVYCIPNSLHYPICHLICNFACHPFHPRHVLLYLSVRLTTSLRGVKNVAQQVRRHRHDQNLNRNKKKQIQG